MTTKPLNPRTSLIAILATLTLSCSPSLSTWIATPSHAEEPTAFAEVEVAGVGATQDEALRQAWSTAVAEVVGTMVDAKTVIQNNKLIQDQILVFSKGYVTKTQTLSTTVEGGVTRVRVRVTVQRSGVEQKIEQLRAEKLWVDAESLIAAAKSKDEMELKRAEMLGEALMRYMEATRGRSDVEMVGSPQVNENDVIITYKVTQYQDPAALTAASAALRDTLKIIADRVGNGNDMPKRVSESASSGWAYDHDVFLMDEQSIDREPIAWWDPGSIASDNEWQFEYASMSDKLSYDYVKKLDNSVQSYHIGNAISTMCGRTRYATLWPCSGMGETNMPLRWITRLRLTDSQGDTVGLYAKNTFGEGEQSTQYGFVEYNVGDTGDKDWFGLVSGWQYITFIDPRIIRCNRAYGYRCSESEPTSPASMTSSLWCHTFRIKLSIEEFARVRVAAATMELVQRK